MKSGFKNYYFRVFFTVMITVFAPLKLMATDDLAEIDEDDSLRISDKLLPVSIVKTKNYPYFIRSERALKVRLVQLFRFAAKKNVTWRQPMIEIAREANMFPDEAKNMILAYSAAGAVGLYALRETRKFLSRKHIRFIIPSLRGLGLDRSIQPLNLRLTFYLRPDASYNLNSYFWRGKISYHLYQRELYQSSYLNFKLNRHWRVHFTRWTRKQYAAFGAGFQYYHPTMYFLFRVEDLVWLDNVYRYTVEFRFSTR